MVINYNKSIGKNSKRLYQKQNWLNLSLKIIDNLNIFHFSNFGNEVQLFF